LATGPLPFPNFSSPAFLANPTNVSVVAQIPDNKTSNVQQFNVQFQQQLTNNTALSVGYVGTRGRNLILYYNLNGRIVDPSAAVSCPRTGTVTANCYTNGGDVNVRDDNGKSQYDALQIQLERRFSQGLQYILAYSFSKTKDNGEGAFDSSDRGGANFLEPFGTSRLDFPHVFTFAPSYEIPFGRGKQFGTDIPRVVDFFVGGWQVNAILRLQSGTPFDVRRNGVRVDLIGDPYTDSDAPYLNFAAFREAPAGRFGSLERNSLRGPFQRQLNLSVFKNFGITERTRLQFRAEAFNLTNSSQFNTPEADITNQANFGRFISTNNLLPFSNRQIQLALRLEF
jgi:hypothetical protein